MNKYLTPTVYEKAFEEAPIAITLVSPEGKWLHFNKRLPEIVGYSPEELLELTFQDITHPDDLAEDLEFVDKMLSKSIDRYQMEKRYLHKNGAEVWILLSVSLVWSEDGQEPEYFISQIQDISKLKELQDRLEKQNRFFVDRELEMVQMKEEMAGMKKEISQTPDMNN